MSVDKAIIEQEVTDLARFKAVRRGGGLGKVALRQP